MTKNLHDEIADASSDDVFDVRPSPDDDPEAAARKVIQVLIGDGPEARPGEIDVDEEELERRILAKGKQRCRVFHLNDRGEADEFADLCQREAVDGVVRFIGKAKDLVDGIRHAVSVRWVEFDEPYRKVSDAAREQMRPKMSEERRRSILDRVAGGSGQGGPIDDGVRCLGATAKGTQCKHRRTPDTQYCAQHHPAPIEAVEMDEPPASHTGLGTGS